MKSITIILFGFMAALFTGCYTQLAIQEETDAAVSYDSVYAQPILPIVSDPILQAPEIIFVQPAYTAQSAPQAPAEDNSVRRTSGNQRTGSERSESAPQESPQRTAGTQRSGR